MFTCLDFVQLARCIQPFIILHASALQKIQTSCRNRTQCLVTPPTKASARSGVTSSAKKRSTPPRTPRRKNRLATISTPLSGSRCTPGSSKRASLSSGSAKNLVGKERKRFSYRLGKETAPLRRSRRAAALKSPYSSPMPASKQRQAAVICNAYCCFIIVTRVSGYMRGSS